MKTRLVIANDKMQKGYRYELSEPAGKNFLRDFHPQLTPKQMLQLGVFGGVYMRDCAAEFPTDWFRNARLAPPEIKDHTAEYNFYEINASQPLSEWKRKGWINQAHDPRGWFQWYCRYYMGRRLPDEDARQIKRWKAIRRHIGQITAHCRPGDLSCRPRQRQALLHWAYDSRKL